MDDVRLRLTRALVRGAAAVAVLVAAVGCGGAPTAGSPPRPVVPAVADGWWAAWNGDDPTRLGALFTEDGVYRDLAVDKTSQGRDGVTEWKRRTNTNIDQVHVTPEGAFRDGDSVAVRSTYSGRLQGAPMPFHVRMVTILQMRGDLIVENADYYNVADILRQSGLPPDWTPPAS